MAGKREHAATVAAGPSQPPVLESRIAVAARSPQVTEPGRSGAVTLAAHAGSWAVLTVEVIGSLVMWSMPFAWMWLGARVFEATGSLGADLAIAFFGFGVSAWFVMVGLHRIDGVWVDLRCLAGYDQVDGVLSRVVVVSFTLGIALFLVWWYIIDQAFVMPFMPMN